MLLTVICVNYVLIQREKQCNIQIVPFETAQCVSWHSFSYQNLRFESRVVLDGSQTVVGGGEGKVAFESRVVLDGSQTDKIKSFGMHQFESRVVEIKILRTIDTIGSMISNFGRQIVGEDFCQYSVEP